MPLSPPILDFIFDKGADNDIRKITDAYYAQSITLMQSFWSEADIDMRFLAGDQTLWGDLYGNLPAFRKRQFQFNRIRRIVNMITGYQRRNRKSTVCLPIDDQDDQLSDDWTKVLFHVNRRADTYEMVSEAFEDAISTGMSLLHTFLDYRDDPISGQLKIEKLAYNEFLMDPYFRKPDLSDCNFVWKRRWLAKEVVASLCPWASNEILAMSPRGNRDGKFQFQPEAYNYGQYNLLTYDEFYYRDFRSQDMLIDLQTGESTQWRGKDEDLKQYLRLYPQIQVKKTQIPTVKLAIMVEGEPIYQGAQPTGIDRYPFVPVLAYYYPQIPYFPSRIQGVVRGLRDAQYLYNHRRIIELDILESQVNSGFIYKADSIVNIDDIFQSGQGRGIAVKQDADISDVQKIQPAQVPPSMIQLSQLLGEEVQQISGVSEELLGMAEGDQSGVLSMLRQGAGLTTLQKLFDQLDFSQKELGRLTQEIVRENYTPAKIMQILKRQPDQRFFNRGSLKHDIVIEEGINTATQNQMQLMQLLHLRQVGVAIPDETLLKAVTLQNKKELIEAVTKAQQQASQKQQQAEEMQVNLAAAQVKLANARAEADAGLGMERISRIGENQALAVERRAEAVRDEHAGILDLTKALKELSSLDIQNLQKQIALFSDLQAFYNTSAGGPQNMGTIQGQPPVTLSPDQGAPPSPPQGI